MYHRTSVKYHSLRYVLWVFVCILHQSSCNLNGSWSNYLSLHQCIVMFLPFEMIWQGEYENVQFALCNDYGLLHLWWRNQKKYSEGIVCDICRGKAGQSIHISFWEAEFKIVGIMGRYGQISVLHILSLLHIFVAQSEARGLSWKCCPRL